MVKRGYFLVLLCVAEFVSAKGRGGRAAESVRGIDYLARDHCVFCFLFFSIWGVRDIQSRRTRVVFLCTPFGESYISSCVHTGIMGGGGGGGGGCIDVRCFFF